MNKSSSMYFCDVCEDSYRMGPQVSQGQVISNHELDVSMICIKGIQDGWNPVDEEQLISHFKMRESLFQLKTERDFSPAEINNSRRAIYEK